MIDCPALIVVEGKTDKAFLSSFINAEIITTNGSEISLDTINYIKEAKNSRDVIVLTDPDSPGKRIRDVLDSHIDGLLHAYIRKEVSIKKGKVGVAESNEEEIIKAIKNLIPSKNHPIGNLLYSDLLELKLVGKGSKKNKEKIEKAFNLGHTNGKSMLQRLNSLGIDKERIEKALNG